MCISNSLNPLELIRAPTLSSVLLSIACVNAVLMLLESVRMSVCYFIIPASYNLFWTDIQLKLYQFHCFLAAAIGRMKL